MMNTDILHRDAPYMYNIMRDPHIKINFSGMKDLIDFRSAAVHKPYILMLY